VAIASCSSGSCCGCGALSLGWSLWQWYVEWSGVRCVNTHLCMCLRDASTEPPCSLGQSSFSETPQAVQLTVSLLEKAARSLSSGTRSVTDPVVAASMCCSLLVLLASHLRWEEWIGSRGSSAHLGLDSPPARGQLRDVVLPLLSCGSPGVAQAAQWVVRFGWSVLFPTPHAQQAAVQCVLAHTPPWESLTLKRMVLMCFGSIAVEQCSILTTHVPPSTCTLLGTLVDRVSEEALLSIHSTESATRRQPVCSPTMAAALRLQRQLCLSETVHTDSVLEHIQHVLSVRQSDCSSIDLDCIE
jgi:hypothetical protein